jgi:hypothetical protein
MHCGLFLLSILFLTTGALYSDWEAFQEYGSETPVEPTSGDLAMNDISTESPSIFSDPGTLENLIGLDDSSTTLSLGHISNVASSENLFDSGEPQTLYDEEEPSNLLASADDACSLPPARRIRARDSGGACADLPALNISPDDLSPDILNDDGFLGLPYWGRKITTYENSNERMLGQIYCPTHKIMLPGLILPVCSSPLPGFTQQLLGDALYTLFYGFMSKFSPASFFSVITASNLL